MELVGSKMSFRKFLKLNGTPESLPTALGLKIFRHSKIVFDLMDEDGGGTISADEFKKYGFLFNLTDQSVTNFFHDFDVTGDEELDYKVKI